MSKLAFVLVLVILILIPPHSRVVDASQCHGYISGICLPDGDVPIETTIVVDTEGGS